MRGPAGGFWLAGVALLFAAWSCANGSADTGTDGTDAGPGGDRDGTVGGDGTLDDGSGNDGGGDDASPCGDTMTSMLNCGSCGHVCAAGEMCSQGQCGLDCMAPEIQCGGDGGAPLFDAGQPEAGDGGDAAVAPSDAGSGPAVPYCAN